MKNIKSPDGFKYEVVSETEVKLVPIEVKYPTSINELENKVTYYLDNMGNIEIHDIRRHNWLKTMVTKNHTDTKQEAEAFLAMMQLRRFMHAWNRIDNGGDEWVPEDGEDRYCIDQYKQEKSIDWYAHTERPLMFKEEETAYLFKKTFKNLLKTATPLI